MPTDTKPTKAAALRAAAARDAALASAARAYCAALLQSETLHGCYVPPEVHGLLLKLRILYALESQCQTQR